MNRFERSTISLAFAMESCIWLLALIFIWFLALNSEPGNLQLSFILASVLSLVFGIAVFVRDGHTLITANGVFNLTAAVFVGFSGFLLLQDSTPKAGWDNVILGLLCVLTAQIFTGLISSAKGNDATSKPLWFKSSVSSPLVFFALSLLAVAGVGKLALGGYSQFVSAAAFVAVAALMVGVVLRENYRIFSFATLVALGAVALYVGYFHSGAGRLHIAALGTSFVILLSMRYPHRILKIIIVILVPVFLYWTAMSRLKLEESLNYGASVGRTGLESMVAALKVLGQLISALRDGEFEPVWGTNYFSVLGLAIPESLWPNAPQALGYELVKFDAPERYGDGIFSTVATWVGEAIFNFGWVGIPIIIVLVSLVLIFYNHYLLRLGEEISTHPQSWVNAFWLIILVMLIATLSDFVWSGLHTYTARMLVRMPFLILLLLWLLAWDAAVAKIRSLKKEAPRKSRQNVR